MPALYRFLLRLYPGRLVKEFGEEMAAVLCELYRDSRTGGFVARWWFGLREVTGLLSGALREQFHERNRNSSGGTMRSFRFPRWTLVTLILVFCAVIAAIEKTRMASVQLSGGSASLHWWALPGVFMFVFALMASIGLVGYCVLHVIRSARTGRG
jgi:hypothetical protein